MEGFKAQFQLAGKLIELEDLFKQLADFLQSAHLSALIKPVNVVLEELFANSVTHGNAEKVTIELSANLDELKIRYEDDGKAFNPFTIAKPDLSAPIEKRSIGGLGIHLIKEMTDQQLYQRKNRCNRITLSMKVK